MTEALLLLFTGCIGLITTIIMITSYKSNPVFNIFLMLIFVTTSTRSLIHGTYLLGLQSIATAESGSSIYLLIVPSFYLYYKNLLIEKKIFQIKDLKHYLFVVFFFLIHQIPSLENSVLFYYGEVTDFILILVFVLFYTWAILKLLTTQLWNKKDLEISVIHYNLIKNWTFILVSFNIIAATFLLLSMYLELTTGDISGRHMPVYIVLCWLFIYFKVLISPEILFGLPVLNKKRVLLSTSIAKENQAAFANNCWKLPLQTTRNNRDLQLQKNTKQHILLYVNEIDRLNYTVGVFRNSKISLNDLASKMDIPVSHLMYLFKYHSKISFSEYRMHGRIQDAIQFIENGFLKTGTLESLSSKVGFSSYNPFFRAFKKITNHTPQEYIKKQKSL